MDKKEAVNAYDEEAVDRAIEGMGMWCALHKGEFLDRAWASFGALCGDEVDLDGCEGIAQTVLNYAFTEWIMFDSMVFGRGCIDEYLDRVEGVSNKNKAICRRGLRFWTGAHILSVSSRRTTRHRSMRVRP